MRTVPGQFPGQIAAGRYAAPEKESDDLVAGCHIFCHGSSPEMGKAIWHMWHSLSMIIGTVQNLKRKLIF